ncbi:hypothetical protein DE146DRAFT_462369 [Phaeosphaeria sp. MPI-PUGE-AT-0046c]|nr:hypothetical protein DE146DRAFT_462369 [Phaeosphaeria sp. MPI-PUGE-AT-0046c]
MRVRTVLRAIIAARWGLPGSSDSADTARLLPWPHRIVIFEKNCNPRQSATYTPSTTKSEAFCIHSTVQTSKPQSESPGSKHEEDLSSPSCTCGTRPPHTRVDRGSSKQHSRQPITWLLRIALHAGIHDTTRIT